MKFTPVGVDIAKHLMQIHFVDEYTGELIDKQLKRNDFLTFFSNREPCLIGMEACGGAHYWARELRKLGHEVRLLKARFVRAFRMGNKTMFRMPGRFGWPFSNPVNPLLSKMKNSRPFCHYTGCAINSSNSEPRRSIRYMVYCWNLVKPYIRAEPRWIKPCLKSLSD